MKVETFLLEDWEETETGLIIEENQEWILVKHIPVDYLIDGFKLYRKSAIVERVHSTIEENIERVLKLKKVAVDKPDNFEFSDTLSILKWSEANYDILEFQDDSESELIYGKLKRVEGDDFTIDFINADGTVDPLFDYEFSLEAIRVISFDSDYHQSIRLLFKDNL
jgi:asparagine synthetase A